MSFAATLGEIVEHCGGGLAAVLMGSDGIAIAHATSEAGRSGPVGVDAETAGVEFGRILDEIRKVSDALGGGAVSETIVRLARFSLIFSPVDRDSFLVVALGPDGNLGKARYLIRRNLMALRQQL